MGRIFARHASPEFNQEMDRLMDGLAADVKVLAGVVPVSLVLGGGYGRGEGGVVLRSGRQAPYNDLDLVLFVKSSVPGLVSGIQAVARKYAALLGIHVDISRPILVSEAKDWPHYLMWHDLFHGHHELLSDAGSLMGLVPDYIGRCPPKLEATNLLVNRGAGVLWASMIHHQIVPLEDGDFARRNYFKCGLGLGDAFLIASRIYAGSKTLQEKLALLRGLASALPAEVPSLYSKSVDFKLEPDRIPIDEGATLDELIWISELWRQVFLQVEAERVGVRWRDVQDYSEWLGIRDTHKNRPQKWPRNFVLNLKYRRKVSFRYPRELLYRELPVLLAGMGHPDRQWRVRAERLLRLWKRFN